MGFFDLGALDRKETCLRAQSRPRVHVENGHHCGLASPGHRPRPHLYAIDVGRVP